MIGDLYVKFNRDGCTAVLHRNMAAKFRLPGDIISRTVYVPRGFRTDFASIPQVARSLVPQLGPWTGAAVVHDALYWVGPSWGFTKKDADTAFNILMKESGVKAWRRNLIYNAVKYFGHMAWNAHRKAGHDSSNMTAYENFTTETAERRTAHLRRVTRWADSAISWGFKRQTCCFCGEKGLWWFQVLNEYKTSDCNYDKGEFIRKLAAHTSCCEQRGLKKYESKDTLSVIDGVRWNHL